MISTKNRIRITACILLALFLMPIITPDKAHSQPCDPNILPVENWEIKYKKRGDRCEGFYRSLVSTETIEVVGVIMGKLRFKLDKAEAIEIDSPFIKDRPVHVRAVGIPMKTYYRMDAKIDAGQTLKWPIKEVILPARLPARKIGLFGWIKEEKEQTFVPLRAKARLKLWSRDKTIRMYLRTSVDVGNVKWRCSEVIERSASPLSRWKSTRKPYYRSGQAIIVPLPVSKAGKLFVEIAAKDANTGQWLKQRAYVLMEEKHEN